MRQLEKSYLIIEVIAFLTEFKEPYLIDIFKEEEDDQWSVINQYRSCKEHSADTNVAMMLTFTLMTDYQQNIFIKEMERRYWEKHGDYLDWLNKQDLKQRIQDIIDE